MEILVFSSLDFMDEWETWRVYIQALVAEASRADVGWDEGKVEISRPVANGMGAAESKDRKFLSVIDGYIASHAC